MSKPAPPPALTKAERWELRQAIDAIVTMIVTMGGTLTTAYRVAAEFAQGCEPDAPPDRRTWRGT